MVSCAACGRSQTKNVTEGGITFHHFPKSEERRKVWTSFINKLNWIPPKNVFLCSLHFADDCFDRTSSLKVRLKPNAFPTITIIRLKHVRSLCKEEKHVTRKLITNQEDESLESPLHELLTPSGQIVQRTLTPPSPSTSFIPLRSIEDSVSSTEEVVRSVTPTACLTVKPITSLKLEVDDSPTTGLKLEVDDSPTTGLKLEVVDSPTMGLKLEVDDSPTTGLKLEVDDSPTTGLTLKPIASLMTTPITSLELEVDDSPRKVFLKRKLQEMYQVDAIKSKKIRYLQKKNWRQKKKIESLTSIIKELKKQKPPNEECGDVLLQSLGDNKDLI